MVCMPRELRGVYKKMILYPTKTKFPEIFTYGATFFHTADLDSSPSVPLCQTSVLPKKRYPAKLEKLIPYIHILIYFFLKKHTRIYKRR
jgi:hypothetical protein